MRPLLAGRVAAGFTLNVLDTPGLLDGDSVSSRGLMALRAALNGRKVDASRVHRRLDTWRVDNADKSIFTSLAENFGAELWERTILGFSHAQTTPPNGKPYDEFVNARVEQYRNAIPPDAGDKTWNFRDVLIENGSRCKTNGEGEKIVNDQPWLSTMVTTLVDMACSKEGYEYDNKAGKKLDPTTSTRFGSCRCSSCKSSCCARSSSARSDETSKRRKRRLKSRMSIVGNWDVYN